MSLKDASEELGKDIDENELFKYMDMCSYCFMWYTLKELHNDSAGFPACPTCLDTYGY